MPRGAGAMNLRDKYLNYFSQGESSAASTSLQTFEYDTGMSPRGGYIWEVHFIELTFSLVGTVASAAGLNSIQVTVSFVGGQSSHPHIDTYGTLWERIVMWVGNGTYNQPYWYEPADSTFHFSKPMLYCKNKMYAYLTTSISSASQGFRFRIGYTTRKISGPLLWEAVEQFLSEG